jgi:hypothetical protein
VRIPAGPAGRVIIEAARGWPDRFPMVSSEKLAPSLVL